MSELIPPSPEYPLNRCPIVYVHVNRYIFRAEIPDRPGVSSEWVYCDLEIGVRCLTKRTLDTNDKFISKKYE